MSSVTPPPTTPAARRVLVTGGTRSGKSAVAEAAVAELAPDGRVTYLATGPTVDDADWAERLRRHRERRPARWTTVETTDLVAALAALDRPALIDCLGTWLTAQLDRVDAWGDAPGSERALAERVDATVAALERCGQPLVVVTNEVGSSLVSMDRGGRLFTDQLGWLNQRVARLCDRVELVVAGCALTIKG